MKKVVVVGGSGFIGAHVCETLVAAGYEVVNFDSVLPRNTSVCKNVVRNVAQEGLLAEEVSGAYGVINLAGAPIAKKWDIAYKRVIRDSRIVVTEKIVEACARAALRPRALINASAIGYYGNSGATPVTEEAQNGEDFLAVVCRDWEKAAASATILGVRVCTVRTAHVLGSGGILRELVSKFKKGMGGYFASGTQLMPWVSITDIAEIYKFLLETDAAQGAFNTASGVVPQKEFMKTVAKAARAPWCLRVPGFAARMVLGEFASSLLGGQNTPSEKLSQLGFRHKDTKLFETIQKFVSKF